jgi:hypothetical protein
MEITAMSNTVNITEFEGLVEAYAEAKDGGADILDRIKVALAPLCATGKVDTESEQFGKVRDAAARALRVAFFRKARKGVDMDAARTGVDADTKTAKGWGDSDPRKVGRKKCQDYARRGWQDITSKCLPKSGTTPPKSGKSGGTDKAAQGETAPPMTPEVLLGAVDALMVTLSVDAGKAFLHALRNNCKAYGMYLDAGKPVPKAV